MLHFTTTQIALFIVAAPVLLWSSGVLVASWFEKNPS